MPFPSLFVTVAEGEGHYMYNLRIIPTVYKKLGQAPQYSYEISFQESLHRVRLSSDSLPRHETTPNTYFEVCLSTLPFDVDLHTITIPYPIRASVYRLA